MPPNHPPSNHLRRWPTRIWIAIPDWLFRAGGVAFFATYLWHRAQTYLSLPVSEWGPYCVFPDNIFGGMRLDMPWVPILVDMTFVLIILSFCFRQTASRRAENGWVIFTALLAAYLPLIVLWIGPALGWVDADWQRTFDEFAWRKQYTWYLALIFGILITVGNAIDVWGYSTLVRSFSIVPEPRTLKTTGPYRFVRHPVYFGQFMAQAAVFLIAFRPHVLWVCVYIAFVALQLYRCKLEERVLEEAFGQTYLQWKEKTFWFLR